MPGISPVSASREQEHVAIILFADRRPSCRVVAQRKQRQRAVKRGDVSDCGAKIAEVRGNHSSSGDGGEETTGIVTAGKESAKGLDEHIIQ